MIETSETIKSGPEFDTTTPIPPRSKWADLARRIPLEGHTVILVTELPVFQAALNKEGKGITTRPFEGDEKRLHVWAVAKKTASKPRKPREARKPKTNMAPAETAGR